LDEETGIIQGLAELLKLEHMPDLLLSITIDMPIWINSLDLTLVKKTPRDLVKEVLVRPFCKPDTKDIKYLIEKLQSPSSQIDVLNSLLRHAELLVRFIREENEKLLHASEKESTRSEASLTVLNTTDRKASVVSSVSVVAFEMKLSWIIGFLAGMIPLFLVPPCGNLKKHRSRAK
jgi:hypothetical protein